MSTIVHFNISTLDHFLHEIVTIHRYYVTVFAYWSYGFQSNTWTSWFTWRGRVKIREVYSVLRQWDDARIWEYSSGVRHEEHEDDHVEEDHVQGAPQRLVKPSVHDQPSGWGRSDNKVCNLLAHCLHIVMVNSNSTSKDQIITLLLVTCRPL